MLKYDVFISYSHQDPGYAQNIQKALSKIGISSFYDGNISGGAKINRTIASAIKNCQLILLIGSKNAYASPSIENEIDFASHLDVKRMLYRIDNTSVPDSIKLSFATQNWISAKEHDINTLALAIKKCLEGKAFTDLKRFSWQFLLKWIYYLTYGLIVAIGVIFLAYTLLKGSFLGIKEDIFFLFVCFSTLLFLHYLIKHRRLAYYLFFLEFGLLLPLLLGPFITPYPLYIILWMSGVLLLFLTVGLIPINGTRILSLSIFNYKLIKSDLLLFAVYFSILGAILGIFYLLQPMISQKQDVQQRINFKYKGVGFDMVKVAGLDSCSFYMGETEVTQGLWEAVMGTPPSEGVDYPMARVSWDEVVHDFIRKLNKHFYIKLKRYQFSLPTEKEWLFAAKGGKNHGFNYSGSDDIDIVAVYKSNSSTAEPCPVKTKRSNEFGLYDMTGNVWEWCLDAKTSSYNERRVRGGSRFDDAAVCRLSQSEAFWPSNEKYKDVGFRLELRHLPYSNESPISNFDHAKNCLHFDHSPRLAFFFAMLSARAGYSPAQYWIGTFYSEGRSPVRKPNFHRAIIWFERAKESGNLNAIYDLGNCFFHGYGVNTDLTRAAEMYRLAAEGGHVKAQNDYGNCLIKGMGVEKNVSSAIQWLTTSANGGCPDAYYTLADCYENGEGVPQNKVIASQLRKKAEEHSDFDYLWE